jgi:5-methylcytosine-specific restriction endonuclease McrA
VVSSRRKKKQKLVDLFGGECQRCGYKKYIGALDFHHIDPSRKSFSLSVKGLCYSWDTILKEAQKCILLCKNCHAEIEAKNLIS